VSQLDITDNSFADNKAFIDPTDMLDRNAVEAVEDPILLKSAKTHHVTLIECIMSNNEDAYDKLQIELAVLETQFVTENQPSGGQLKVV
jgi:hypothetical protein